MKKKLILKVSVLITVLCSAFQVKAQDVYIEYMPPLTEYNVTTTHNAYATATQFSSTSDFVRGFCFAYDALSPLSQGYTGQIWNYVELPPTVIVPGGGTEVFTGLSYKVRLQMLMVPLQPTSTLGDNAYSMRAYGDKILYQYYNDDIARWTTDAATNPYLPYPDYNYYVKARDFWYGYAKLCEQAFYNPLILVMQQGEVM